MMEKRYNCNVFIQIISEHYNLRGIFKITEYPKDDLFMW